MGQSNSISVDLDGRSYSIIIGDDNLSTLPGLISQFTDNRQVAIVTVPPVAQHYLDKMLTAFQTEWQVFSYQVPDGEESKSIEMAQCLYSWLIRNHFERQATIIALGGGVIGDLAGFVAATYMRGVRLVHVPTSLLAQVDSSIGGKVGVNHPSGKNLIGAFYQPCLVLHDISVLETLPAEEFICGMGEILKYGFIYDERLFKRIESHLDDLNRRSYDQLFPVIGRCAEIKAEVVSQDEREKGLRAILNFGHTFGHAFEAFYHYQNFKHGQAVLIGMKCALEISRELDLIEKPALKRGHALIDRMQVELPTGIRKPAINELLKIVKHDKKVVQGVVNLVLLKDIGQATVVPVDDEALIAKGFAAVLGDDNKVRRQN
jgi:3-dehydroquinate synthase